MSTTNQFATNAYVGQPIKRLEDRSLLCGRGLFVDDIQRDRLLHAVILRSPVGHGRIRVLDTSLAEKLTGVHSVITAGSLPTKVPLVPLRLMPMKELEPLGQPVIARKKVRYTGEALAVILAETQAIGEDARTLIEVEIEPLPAVANTDDARAQRTLLFKEWESNKAITYSAVKGDTKSVFQTAEYVRRQTFRTRRNLALPLESRGIFAEWNSRKKHLNVEGAAKVPFANRRILSAMLDVPETSIDMIENDVGGGFGARGEFYPEDFLIPFSAKLSGRPIKWIEDRRDHILTTGHAREMNCEIEIACNPDGTILGLRGEVWVDAGAYYRTNGTISPRNVIQFMSGPYRIPNIELKSHVMLTNKAPIGTYRGPGRFETDFFRERLFDIVSKELKLDPSEFRKNNLVSEAEIPYSIASIAPVPRKEEFDSGNYHLVLDRCLDEFGWKKKFNIQGQLIDGLYHGVAVGCFIEGGAAGPSENARALLTSDGTLEIFVGSTAVGQGIRTTLSQIAADAIELPIDRIKLYHGSTPYVSEGFGSYHSRATVMGGSAILLAVKSLKNKIAAEAADIFSCTAEEVSIVDGKAISPTGKVITFKDLSDSVGAVEETFHNHRHTYAYGSAAVHVTVDPDTGEVGVIDLVFFEDVGKIVNPLILQGQALGAIVQGLGGALLEHAIYDSNAQLVTSTLADYLVPLSCNFPNIRAYMLEEKPSPISPMGVKGGGEGGILPMGGLMANAVSSALSSLSCEPVILPLTPTYVLSMIKEAQNWK